LRRVACPPWERSYGRSAGLSTPGSRAGAHHGVNASEGALMKYLCLMRTAAFAAALEAGSVLAQMTAPVVAGVAPPPPAEERNSSGAVVLEKSMVRAQRENAFQSAAARTGVASIGRGALRAAMKARTRAELAQAREAEAVELYQRGAGSLTQK